MNEYFLLLAVLAFIEFFLIVRQRIYKRLAVKTSLQNEILGFEIDRLRAILAEAHTSKCAFADLCIVGNCCQGNDEFLRRLKKGEG